MRSLVPQIAYNTAVEALSYDPESGALTWREDGRRVRAGDHAGTLTRDGYLTVTIGGKKIRGQYLAWLLHYGEWPRGPLRLKSAIGIDPHDDRQLAARSDLRIDNIIPASDVLSDTPAATRYRHYAAERRRMKDIYERGLAGQAQSSYSNVEFDYAIDKWVVKQLLSKPEERSPRAAILMEKCDILSVHPNQESAERAALDLHMNREFLSTSEGNDKIPQPLPPGIGEATAGPLGPTLTDLHLRLAYTEKDGILIWRNGAKRYQNAAVPTTGRTSYVPYMSWRLPAHSVAFFLHNGIWPLRGEIAPYDGNWRNIRITNLMYKHANVLAPYPLDGSQLK